MSCVFPDNYVRNLNYVSTQLLLIINTNILIGSQSTYLKVTDDNGDCNPPDNENITKFGFNEWKIIQNKLLVEAAAGQPGLLIILEDTLDCISKNITDLGYGLQSQFERFECLVNSLKERLECISCGFECEEVVGDFLCLLLQILTKLISAIAKAASLVYYADCREQKDKLSVSFFECIACDFINDLCDLEKLINELTAIIVAFATCNLQQCTPCYVAPCAPKKVRPVCPPHMMKDGYGYGYKPKHGGSCGCSCNKGCKY